jgi:hypothetical protein
VADPFIVLFQRGDFSAELYAPQGIDTQQPHEQDEVYIVASGSLIGLKSSLMISKRG